MSLVRELTRVWARDGLRHAAWVAGVLTAVAAYVIAMSMTDRTMGQMTQLFSTSAQVLAGLSVALPLSTVIIGRAQPLHGALAPAIVMILVGLVASLIALIPGMCAAGLRVVFAVTAAGILAGVTALGLILTQAVAPPVTDAEWTARLAAGGINLSMDDPEPDPELERLMRLAITGGVLERHRARRAIRQRSRD